MAEKAAIYKVRFMHEGRVFELYARNVCTSAFFGFVEVEKLLWGKKSDIIVDPTEQELKNEFDGVKRTFIPMHAIVRIDEVDKSGPAKILPLPAGAREAPLPFPLYPQGQRKPTPKKD
jgi:hypothetical protein